jgi:hypothetical protein
MKHFTPELFVRLQDLRDRAAIQDWERATQEYASSIEGSLSQLPRPLQHLLGKLPLHDADVLSVSRSKDVLTITLRPELFDGQLVVLTYTLVESPRINRSALPRDYCTAHVAWLYDEVSLPKPIPGPATWQTAADRRRGDDLVTVYCHDILLSNGWEVGLTFRKLTLAQPEALIPAPSEEDQEKTLPRSA